MAAKRRHWKEKGGRFWARIAVPKNLQEVIGKSELIEALGGELRDAERKHAAAVVRLQAQIETASRSIGNATAPNAPMPGQRSVSASDHEHVVWDHFNNLLRVDTEKRAALPTPGEIEAEREKIWQLIDAGEVGIGRDPIGFFNNYTDFELKDRAREFDANIRTRRLSSLRLAVNQGDTRLVVTLPPLPNPV